ncbi:hypothetical protein BJP40_08525 [Streptomyces sp. CC53]|uniref:hypothetical protein n=1 Tax=unclassified Streptomyces TaxID=2593676 RepID=UPI0008DD1FB2|nr:MULTISPECIES: hypothetical protein [unclassified Streptomyces]OII60894.1 hypothetical protein BJP40_08525 [Streptomyces sp. CC53]
MFVSPENRRFLPGVPPVLLPGGAALRDVLAAPDGTGGRVPVCDGRSIAVMTTLCVVDGPGDAGSVTQAALSEAEIGAAAGRAQAVRDAGRALVVSLEGQLTEEHGRQGIALLHDGRARGGFVRALG